MENILHTFEHAYHIRSGPLLATTLDPIAPPQDPQRWSRFFNSANPSSITQTFRSAFFPRANVESLPSQSECNAWLDIYVSFWKAIGEILAAEKAYHPRWSDVFDAWKEVANALIRGYNSAGFEAWTVPCLYVIGRYLRIFAIKADDLSRKTGITGSVKTLQDDMVSEFTANEKLEDAARVINRIFTLCISDRAPLAESRKWGLYHTVNLLFKTYFKLNSIGLSKNILKALQASRTDMPSLDAFPKSHVVTFKYYVGVIHFLEEDYVQAEENLTHAWTLCLPNAMRNKELILTYLIPCHLLTTHTLPTLALLTPFSRLYNLFAHLSTCIKKGDLAGYDAAMAIGEDEFVKRRIYLTLERGRDIALRNLLRKVYLAGGFEESLDNAPPRRRTRIPVAEFGAAICLGSQVAVGELENDEVECLLANMIYKNLMKGYISRERGIVVLSKGSAFPGTGV